MSLVFYSYLIFALVAIILALAAIAELGLAFIGRQDLRRGRLRNAVFAVALCIAAVTSAIAAFHFLFAPAMLQGMRPEYIAPFDSLRLALALLAPCFAFLTAAGGACALGRGPRQRKLLIVSAGSLVLFLAAVAGSYFLFYQVQLPAFQRYAMVESTGQWLTKVGGPAPDVSVTMLDGKQLQLADLRGKVLLVNFFATWCGPCMAELPHLEQIWKTHGSDPNFRMLIIGREESLETVQAFQNQRGFTFPMAVDPDSSAFHEFAKEYIPRTYLISRDGKILFQTHGFSEIEVYQRELATLQDTVDRELAAEKQSNKADR